MAMGKPVARLIVDLDVAYPQRTVNLHLGVEEVGPGVEVVQTGVNHLNGLAVGGLQSFQRKELVLPAIVQ